MTDLLLDEYGDIVTDDAGSEVLADDSEGLIQDIRHRLMTAKGSLPEDADYGGDLPYWLHVENTLHFRRALVNSLQTELAKETRILPQRTTIRVLRMTRESVAVLVQFVRKDDLQPGQTEVEAS